MGRIEILFFGRESLLVDVNGAKRHSSLTGAKGLTLRKFGRCGIDIDFIKTKLTD